MAPKKPRQWTAEVDGLRATIHEMAKKIDTVDSLERRIEALESQCQEESKRVSTYFDMTVRMGQITAQSVRGAMKWGERSSTLQAEVRKLEEREKQGKRTRRELEGRVEDAEERYQRAERQLDASEHFRSTADEYSGAEIAAAIERLNDVVYQAACTLADRALEEAGSTSQSAEAVTRLQKQKRLSTKEVKKEWEGYLVQQMVSEAEGKNPAFLKSMIQSLVARWCYQTIKAWCRQNPDTEDTMKAIWDGIREKYDSGIAKNWLAILHSQLDLGNINTSEVLEAIWHLMVVAGWKGSPDTLKDITKDRFDGIIELVLKIREMIFEGVLSVEFEVLYPEKQTPYLPEQMDIVGEAGVGEEDPIDWEGLPIDFPTGLGVAYRSPQRTHVISKSKVFMTL